MALRLGLPSLIGYLVAGIAVGPFTPGLVADAELAPQLSEIGVILLMFGVGMHFSLRDLLAVWKVAVPGAIGQIAAATAMGAAVAHTWGWSLGAGLVFGLALSVASTVVLLRALEALNEATSANGRLAIGWLIVEDLVMVLALVLIPAVAGPLKAGGSIDALALAKTVALTLGEVIAFVVVMLVAGRRAAPWLLSRADRSGSQEVFTLAAITMALGTAFAAAELFHVSFALGAFFAGIVVNESDLSHRAAKRLQPLQDVFAALFFVAVGMLFDPRIVVERPFALLATLAIITLGKIVAAYVLVRLMRRSDATGRRVAGALAQIGEFSFILAGLGVAEGLMPAEGQGLIVAGALLSIALNPVVMRVLRPRSVAA